MHKKAASAYEDAALSYRCNAQLLNFASRAKNVYTLVQIGTSATKPRPLSKGGGGEGMSIRMLYMHKANAQKKATSPNGDDALSYRCNAQLLNLAC